MRPSALRHIWRLLPLCLLAAAAGCGTGPPKPPPSAKVSGTVLYRGQPLPGGRISFVTVAGGFATTATIREDGKYEISAPTGDVQISVDNSMLMPRRGSPMQPPQSEGMKQHSGGAEDPVKGQYVNLPSKYFRPDTSGLTYTVKKGDQTHDVPLD
jgi:hypothetical protein